MPSPPSKLRANPPRRRAAPVAIGLTREAVIAAALEQIDRHGLGSFSIRNVAKSLGVNPTVVGWHIGSRNLVLAEVVAAVQRELAPPMREGETWQDWLRSLFVRYRAVIRQHPNVAPLIGAELVSNARVNLDLVERILHVLSAAGFADRALRGAYSAVVAAMTGFTTQEFAPMPDDNLTEWQDEMRERLAGVTAEDHPVLARNLDLLINQAFIVRWENGVGAPLDDGFEMFVDCLILGIETRASRGRNDAKAPRGARGGSSLA